MDQRPPHKARYTETNRTEGGKKVRTHRHRGNFLDRTPMAYALRSRIHKWDFMKLHSFYKVKDTVRRTKWQSTDWEKIFTNPTSDRELVFNIYKVLKKLDSRDSNNSIKNGVQS